MASENEETDSDGQPPGQPPGRPMDREPIYDDARFDRAALGVTLIGAFLLILPFIVYVYVRLTRH